MATGVAGVAGNKGGIAIKMELHGSAIAFVCVHLAAHHGHADQRNANYAQIRDRLIFTEGEPGAAAGGGGARGEGERVGELFRAGGRGGGVVRESNSGHQLL